MVGRIKTCVRRALSQRKKLELNQTYQLREKSKKPPERTGFQKTDLSGGFLDFSSGRTASYQKTEVILSYLQDVGKL